MGNKGDKLSPESAISAESLTAKLEPIGGITTKKMFGGHGIFHEGKMFGLIDSKGKAFLKVDDSTKPTFLENGGTQHSRMPYYSITEAMFADDTLLVEMTRKAIALSK